MAKSPEAKQIEEELKREFEGYKSRVLPKFQKKARGRLRRLQKALNRIKPLKIKVASITKVEGELKSKLLGIRDQISQARKKASSDRIQIKSLRQEIKRLKKEIPLLEKKARSLSRVEKVFARKHKKVSKVLNKLQKKLKGLEKKKEKIVASLQKYLG